MTMKESKREIPSASRWFDSVRFLQVTLAVTTFLALLYMWQLTSETLAASRAAALDDATHAKAAAEASSLTVRRDRIRAHTQYVVRGFDEAHKFVRDYNVETQGPLFLLFTSGVNASGAYWFPPCKMVKDAVEQGFQRAPRGSRLLEIQVGSETYWNDLMNPFRQNQLFYIDYLPTLMRYDGGGNSSALLAGPNCLNQDLLDVVFRVHSPATRKPPTNRIIHCNASTQVMDFVDAYDFSYSLFLFFISGVHAFNNRLWCPFCDKADVPVLYYFNQTAPAHAVLLRIVVAREPRQWFDEDNDFVSEDFSRKVVEFDGVPYLIFMDRNQTTNKLVPRPYMAGTEEHAKLANFFRQTPRPAVPANN